MIREEKLVYAENIEHFIDQAMQAGVEGWARVSTGELAESVMSNYWKMTCERFVAEPVIPAVTPAKKAK